MIIYTKTAKYALIGRYFNFYYTLTIKDYLPAITQNWKNYMPVNNTRTFFIK